MVKKRETLACDRGIDLTQRDTRLRVARNARITSRFPGMTFQWHVFSAVSGSWSNPADGGVRRI